MNRPRWGPRRRPRTTGTLSRTRQLLELALFLGALVPLILLLVATLQPQGRTFAAVAFGTMLQNVLLLGVVLLFVWRNREPLREFGVHVHHAGRELLLGVGLFVPFVLLIGVVQQIMDLMGLPLPETPPEFLVPHGAGEHLLALGFLVTVAVAEEIVFRGYLLHRFHNLTGSRAAAVILSSLLFALGHGYEGTGGMIAIGLIGVIFAGVYLWRASLVAPIAMHFLQNFVGMIAVPALG